LYDRYLIGWACGEGENGSIYDITQLSNIWNDDASEDGQTQTQTKFVMKFSSQCDHIA